MLKFHSCLHYNNTSLHKILHRKANFFLFFTKRVDSIANYGYLRMQEMAFRLPKGA